MEYGWQGKMEERFVHSDGRRGKDRRREGDTDEKKHRESDQKGGSENEHRNECGS